jgi:hypothetical protein
MIGDQGNQGNSITDNAIGNYSTLGKVIEGCYIEASRFSQDEGGN